MNLTEITVLEQTSFVPINQIELSPLQISELNLADYLFIQAEGPAGKSARCMIRPNPALPAGTAKLSKRAKSELGPCSTILLHQVQYQNVQTGIPKVENITKKVVLASHDLVDKYSDTVELINADSGFRLPLKIRKADNPAFENKIFINRYHKLLLGIDGNSRRNLIITGVPKQKSTVLKRMKQITKIIALALGKKFIGYREVELRAAYIYPFDESHKVARLHPNVRKVLGIEESDALIIEYNGNKVKLPVLDIDTNHVEEICKVEQEFIDGHLSIGIPAAMRKKLGVPHIGTVINARRSMASMLFKHINRIILPVLALWFTVLQFFQPISEKENIIKYIAALLILTPVIIFAAVSEERSKVK